MTSQPIPIVCDMTDAPDTTEERLAEYRELFGTVLVSREHTETGIRFTFRADPGVGDHVRDLAAREKACCAFFDFIIEDHDDVVTMDASVVDDPIARQILEEYYRLPDTLPDGAAALVERFADNGLEIVIDDEGIMRPATNADLGIDAR